MRGSVCFTYKYNTDMTMSSCHDISCLQSYHLKTFLIKVRNTVPALLIEGNWRGQKFHLRGLVKLSYMKEG